MTIDQLPTLTDKTGFNIITPVSKGGADYGMPGRLIELTMSASTATFNVADGSRFLLYTSSANDAAKGLYIFNVANVGGAVTYAAVRNATNITIDVSTANVVKITSQNAGAMGFLIFAGSISA